MWKREEARLRKMRNAKFIAVSSSSGSLPTRQVQMFDVDIPLVVELVLSASYILPPSSSPASFVSVFLLIFFLAFSLRLPFLTVIRVCPIHFFCLVFIVRMRDR